MCLLVDAAEVDYAESISYFVKYVVLRRIDLDFVESVAQRRINLVHRRIDVLLRIDLVLVKSTHRVLLAE